MCVVVSQWIMDMVLNIYHRIACEEPEYVLLVLCTVCYLSSQTTLSHMIDAESSVARS